MATTALPVQCLTWAARPVIPWVMVLAVPTSQAAPASPWVQVALNIPAMVLAPVQWDPCLLTTATAVLNRPCPWAQEVPLPVVLAPVATLACTAVPLVQ